MPRRFLSVTAVVLAVYPNAWQFDVRLFSESLATPLTVGVLLVALTRPPGRSTAIWTGVLMGACLLTRPSSMLLFASTMMNPFNGVRLA